MTNDKIIQQIASEVKKRFESEGSGHDWWHVYRVQKMAQRIGKKEKADLFIVNPAALLHDIADWKFHNGDETAGVRVAREILSGYKVSVQVIDHVCEIVDAVPYKGAGVKTEMETLGRKSSSGC